RQLRGPLADVDVAPDRGDRRDRLQRGQHLRLADVAGVDQMVAALQEGERLGPELAVGVGDQADAHGPGSVLPPERSCISIVTSPAISRARKPTSPNLSDRRAPPWAC